jgi:hypothetical protein
MKFGTCLPTSQTNILSLSSLTLKMESVYFSETLIPTRLRGIITNTVAQSRYSDWLRAGRPKGRSSIPDRGKIFLLSTSSRPVLGFTQPPIQWVLGALSPVVKRPGREADHSPPTSAEVKNTWIYTSTPPIRLHGFVLK